MGGIRVLLVNPMRGYEGFLPLGISNLSAALKKGGHQTRLFDTTFFELGVKTERQQGEEITQFKPVNMSPYGVDRKERDVEKKLNEVIAEYQPQLVAISSATSYNYPLARHLIESIADYSGPIIVGGNHVSVSPDEMIGQPRVDMICLGEGEEALLELCDALAEGKEIKNIRNLWVKKGGEIYKNHFRPLVDLDSLPHIDWTIYDERNFYRPFNGKVYRYGHIEMSRGCPYRCTYCINKGLSSLYEGNGKYHRKKSPQRVVEEVAFLKEKYGLEMVKFWDETFLAMGDPELEKFAHLYKPLNLPFLITTRPETMTLKRGKILREIGCVAVSIGIESGNADIRNNVLNRHMSPEAIISAFRVCNEVGIQGSAFSMIGLPYETRKNIFETIELNRRAKVNNANPCIFIPFKGTDLYDLCLKENFLKDPHFEVETYYDSVLEMPQLSRKQIRGLRRTFLLYLRYPKLMYPIIRLAEGENPLSRAIHKFLMKSYNTWQKLVATIKR